MPLDQLANRVVGAAQPATQTGEKGFRDDSQIKALGNDPPYVAITRAIRNLPNILNSLPSAAPSIAANAAEDALIGGVGGGGVPGALLGGLVGMASGVLRHADLGLDKDVRSGLKAFANFPFAMVNVEGKPLAEGVKDEIISHYFTDKLPKIAKGIARSLPSARGSAEDIASEGITPVLEILNSPANKGNFTNRESLEQYLDAAARTQMNRAAGVEVEHGVHTVAETVNPNAYSHVSVNPHAQAEELAAKETVGQERESQGLNLRNLIENWATPKLAATHNAFLNGQSKRAFALEEGVTRQAIQDRANQLVEKGKEWAAGNEPSIHTQASTMRKRLLTEWGREALDATNSSPAVTRYLNGETPAQVYRKLGPEGHITNLLGDLKTLYELMSSKR